MTKDEIINTQDGQALADAVAVEVMGWIKNGSGWLVPFRRENGEVNQETRNKDWEPHQPTEKGKAQCWDLMVNLGLIVMPYIDNEWGAAQDNGKNITIEINEANPQIAVLKAALLSVKDGK